MPKKPATKKTPTVSPAEFRKFQLEFEKLQHEVEALRIDLQHLYLRFEGINLVISASLTTQNFEPPYPVQGPTGITADQSAPDIRTRTALASVRVPELYKVMRSISNYGLRDAINAIADWNNREAKIATVAPEVPAYIYADDVFRKFDVIKTASDYKLLVNTVPMTLPYREALIANLASRGIKV